MRSSHIVPVRPASIQRPGILRGRQLEGLSFREIAAADGAVLGKSIEPTVNGVSSSLELYAQILQETRHSFRRIACNLLPVTVIGMAIGFALAIISSLTVGSLIIGAVVIFNPLSAYFQAQSDNSNRIFNSAHSLRLLLAKMDPAVIRAGLRELKAEDPASYALITDPKALSGEMGRKYGADFIALLRSFEA